MNNKKLLVTIVILLRLVGSLLYLFFWETITLQMMLPSGIRLR